MTLGERICAQMNEVVRLILGTPNQKLSTRDELRYGSNGSLAIIFADHSDKKAGDWFDHENVRGGGPWEFLRVYGHMERAEAEEWFLREFGGDRKPRIVGTYNYVDETGALLFQVVRRDPKSFRQRRPDGNGGWLWDLDGVRRVPYHLDELVAARTGTNGSGAPWRVYIVEGEKDADRLRQWGLSATTNPGGAGKWHKDYGRYFANAEAVILPDNDQPGRAHARQVAANLLPIAANVRILDLLVPEKGDVSDAIGDGLTQSDLAELVECCELFRPPREPVENDPLNLDGLAPEGQPAVKWAGADTSPIPPRQWLLGTFFCCGFLSGLTGPGAVGKTALRLLQLIALALGRDDLTGEHVFKRTKVLIVCLEDDENELRRRIRSACLHYGIDERELVGWLAYWTPRDLRLLELDRWGQITGPGELGEALRTIIKRLGIGLVSVDPFVKSHCADENDNVAIDKAAGYFLQIGHDCGCAVDYSHHHRKGVVLPGDPDSGRGASSLSNASRLVWTLTKMSLAEAEMFNIKPRERLLYVRLDDAKVNIVPPAETTIWFKLIGVHIGNGADWWPKGDNVQTVERWYPPDPFEDLEKSTIAKIFDELRAGPKTGEWYSANPQAKDNWAGTVICSLTGKSEADAKRILATWRDKDVLIEVNSAGRKSKDYKLNETMAGDILGSLYRPPGAGMPKDRHPPTETPFDIPEAPPREPEWDAQAAKARKCTNSEAIALNLLRKALKDRGIYPPADPEIPPDTLCVLSEIWRDLAYEGGLGGDTASGQKSAFKRIREGLIAKEIVGYWKGLAWLCP